MMRWGFPPTKFRQGTGHPEISLLARLAQGRMALSCFPQRHFVNGQILGRRWRIGLRLMKAGRARPTAALKFWYRSSH